MAIAKKAQKKFDCVEMMHHGALRIHEALKDKSKEERLAYWRDRHAETLDELSKARASNRSIK